MNEFAFAVTVPHKSRGLDKDRFNYPFNYRRAIRNRREARRGFPQSVSSTSGEINSCGNQEVKKFTRAIPTAVVNKNSHLHNCIPAPLIIPRNNVSTITRPTTETIS